MKENDFLEPKSGELLAASENPPHFTSITPRGELTLKKGPNINETLCKNTNLFSFMVILILSFTVFQLKFVNNL